MGRKKEQPGGNALHRQSHSTVGSQPCQPQCLVGLWCGGGREQGVGGWQMLGYVLSWLVSWNCLESPSILERSWKTTDPAGWTPRSAKGSPQMRLGPRERQAAQEGGKSMDGCDAPRSPGSTLHSNPNLVSGPTLGHCPSYTPQTSGTFIDVTICPSGESQPHPVTLLC